MEELNLILDMTHLADASFWEAANRFKGSVLASHNNCRAIAPGDRQFDDAQIPGRSASVALRTTSSPGLRSPKTSRKWKPGQS